MVRGIGMRMIVLPTCTLSIAVPRKALWAWWWWAYFEAGCVVLQFPRPERVEQRWFSFS